MGEAIHCTSIKFNGVNTVNSVKQSTPRAANEPETAENDRNAARKTGGSYISSATFTAVRPKQARRHQMEIQHKIEKSYYLCVVVPLDISKDSCTIDNYELLREGVRCKFEEGKGLTLISAPPLVLTNVVDPVITMHM